MEIDPRVKTDFGALFHDIRYESTWGSKSSQSVMKLKNQ
jgi:hypothetical protein